MSAAVIQFFRELPWKLLGLTAIVTVSVIGGCHYGESTVNAAWDAERAAAKLAAAQTATTQAEVTTQVVTQYVDRVQVVKERGKEIIKEVPVYVSSAVTCDLPGGFRVLHDAAAQGELPDPAGVADAPAASVETAAATVVENYATYHEVAEQLKALQSWVNQQEQAQ
ncbi:hypothetical protein [Pseudomonas sp. NBRC 111143]|uniref:hypothetical protein n=1 Tax=Pseudomonas sp. NBRC 111143 TaxID=1661058 RepID=UPI000AD8DA00|nr:hypothetical protein [Pseudomonas sp. NBRC 111143]